MEERLTYTEHEVPEPVGGGTQSDTFGSDSEWEGLSQKHPWRRSPEHRVGGYVKDGHCDLDVSARGLV